MSFRGLIAVACFAAVFPVAVALVDVTPSQTPPEPEGMESIFNGRDLAGWDGDPRLWSVRDGVIHGETTKENVAKGNTFLIWQGGGAPRLRAAAFVALHGGEQFRHRVGSGR